MADVSRRGSLVESTVLRVEPRLRPGAATAQVIEQGGGAGQPSRFNEGEAADGFAGIELSTHQSLQGLAGILQLVVDHVDHLLEPLPQQKISVRPRASMPASAPLLNPLA